MSANDILLLNSHFDTWKMERGEDLEDSDPFTYYVLEQFLKPFDISDEEILDGVVDGGEDGGVDACYFFVNNGIVNEETQMDSRAKKKDVQLIFVQVKDSESGFSFLEINKFRDFCDDLLDLSRPAADYRTYYNRKVRDFMDLFKEKYKQILTGFPTVNVQYFYITKTTTNPDKKANASLDKVKKMVDKHLTGAICDFECVNVRRLLEQIKIRPLREKTLSWSEQPLVTADGYIGLMKLPNYYQFLVDEKMNLVERLLDSNVRGYQQDTSVNQEIRHSLADDKKTNFWLLNNGITILASKAQKAGHLGLALEDAKIVNGLQTSREIFEYFSTKPKGPDERKILIRVIETDDSQLQDAIIKATNRQNKLPPVTLRGTDEIQQKIDTLFKASGLYYDRKRGFYKDKGMPAAKIVSMATVVQAMLAITLRMPNEARSRPSYFLAEDERYVTIFNDVFPLELYLKSVLIMRRVENVIREQYELKGTTRSNVMYYVAMLVTCRKTNSVEPSPSQIASIEISGISPTEVIESYEKVWKLYVKLGEGDTVAKSSEMSEKLKSYIKRSFAARKN